MATRALRRAASDASGQVDKPNEHRWVIERSVGVSAVNALVMAHRSAPIDVIVCLAMPAERLAEPVGLGGYAIMAKIYVIL